MALNDDEKLEKYKKGPFFNRFNDRQSLFLPDLVQANIAGETFYYTGELSKDEARNILSKGWDPKRPQIQLPELAQAEEKVSKPGLMGLIKLGIFGQKPASMESLNQSKEQKRDSTPPKPK